MTNTPKVLTLTDAAAARIRYLLAEIDNPAAVVRIGVDTKGCSGLTYRMDYTAELVSSDEPVEDNGVTVYVDSQAMAYIMGSEVDYVEGKLQSGFVFDNPNEKGRCGCGVSFQV